ncbi:MAG: sugar transferase [Anaerolineae bacterium]|nr:sugar transferase [Anaerolineae bacterium]
MARLRSFLILTILWFAFLFNIERLDVLGSEPFNLASFVYVLAIAISAALVVFPNLGHQNLQLSRLAVLAIYGVTRTLFRGWETEPVHQFLVEGVALLITLALMRRLSQGLIDFELAVQAFVLNVEGARMLPQVEGAEQANHELYRARRFERPVAVVYCAAPDIVDAGDSQVVTEFVRWRITEAFKRRYQQVQLAHAIASMTYKSDLIVEYGEGVVVCLPETSEAEAQTFARNLSKFAKATLQVDPWIGIACFPDQGLVFEDLAAVAQRDAHVWVESDNTGDSGRRNGTVRVDVDERIRIEREADWVNKLAYQSPSARAIYKTMKRTGEILLVLLTLPFALPAFAITALLVYLDDGRPIFYMQARTGYGGRRFKMYKFRTMYMDAKSIPPRVVRTADGRVQYEWPEKVEKDPRVTRVGRFLRKTSLDELPQLWNVFVGDMSVVGPRPTSWDLDKYTLHQTERLTVRPGITGLWQVCAREATNFDERLLWDMKYIEKMSLWLDMQIVWRTVAQVFAKRGV